MPKGPRGEKRPGDVIGAAIRVAKIATGEEAETTRPIESEANRKGGLKGGKSRAQALSPEQLSEIARLGAAARWRKKS